MIQQHLLLKIKLRYINAGERVVVFSLPGPLVNWKGQRAGTDSPIVRTLDLGSQGSHGGVGGGVGG